MNVLFLTTHLNFGGITSYVVNLARQLKRNGHTVFVASSGGDLTGQILTEGIEHINLDIKTKSELSPKIIFSFLKLKRIIRQKNIQIIHSHTRVTQVLSHLLSRSLSVPYVTTCHGYFKARINRRIFGCWGKIVIAISGPVKKHLITDLGVIPEKVRLVYNGVEARDKREFPRAQIRQRLGLKDGPVVGIIARLSAVKGHKYLIEAMRHVIDEERQAQLLIVGDGPDKKAIVNLIEARGIKDNTVLIPSRRYLDDFFSIMSAYVSPSLQEGLGLSILEAQANSVPTVAFRTGGISDVIKNEVTGLLSEPYDTKALANCILRLIRNKELSLKIKQAAYGLVEKKFSLKVMAENTLKVYEEVSR